MQSRKIQYHHRLKNSSVDKNSPQVINSSPVNELKTNKITEQIYHNHRNSEQDDIVDDNRSIRNTIQSINEKDNVNYLIESSNNQASIFTTAMKNNKIQFTQDSEIHFQDTDHNYVKASDKLFDTIKVTLDYFKKATEISFRNEDKAPTIKLLKEDYEKMKLDYENLMIENKMLKDKNKTFKDSGRIKSSEGLDEGVNVNKFIDSLMFLQTKNEGLEKENRILKKENEDLKRLLKKKIYVDHEPKNKLAQTKSQSILNSQNKNKNDKMENLLKEQISCMKKMLVIVQDGKDNTTSISTSKKKILSDNEYIDSSDIESNIHFEESFNVTNISNSVDYIPEAEIINSSVKEYENKNFSDNSHKFEVLLKPFEKNKKKIENAMDEDPTRISGGSSNNLRNKYMNKDFSQFYLNKEKYNKFKPVSNASFNNSYQKTRKKQGEHSHRVNPNKNY